MLFEKVHLEESEVVLKIVRKHWFVVVSSLLTVALMAFLPFVVFLILAFLPASSNIFDVHPQNYLALSAFICAAWLLLSVMVGFTVWTNYYLDLWIITDRRIIVIEQLHFFNRNVGILRLERLQDIEIKIRGILQTFLNFGSLNVQTAGHFESNFSAVGLPDPRGIQSIVQKASDQRMEKLHSVNSITH